MADQIIPTTADDPEAARAEIERTRARMSETLDEIEDVLLIKKQQLQDRFDLMARIRERPMQAAGAALAAGLVLGLLTGGGGREPHAPRADRSDLWEARARRLLSIARRQEEEIDDLEAALDDLSNPTYGEFTDISDYEDDQYDDGPSRFAELREAVVGRVADFATDTAESLVDAIRRRR